MKRQMVVEVMTTHDLSQRRACGLIGITRRGLKCAPVEDRNRLLRGMPLVIQPTTGRNSAVGSSISEHTSMG